MAKLEEGWYWFRGDIVNSNYTEKDALQIVEVLGDQYENRIQLHDGFLISKMCFHGEFVKVEKPEGW